MMLSLLAQAANTSAATQMDAADAPASWLPVVLLIVMGIGFAVSNIVGSMLIGPGRTGPGKSITYESGMVPIGTTRKRFNVRFYIVAMIFLVIDVEIVFFYPWASIFSPVVRNGEPGQATILLVEMIVFVLILLVAYVYAWGKGVFRWD
ncbi:MAG TPA: NADH-quinone oxidoreductase subunit A [Tepidisphaeraceae bacterium]|nr:NADH-quinone oxidoreductase subunit A [Tepidisphaeraceae bacterium]